ncbi:MAG TPA: CoA-transferase [Ktedonobacteraceae bacterium]|jgi:glutaconate CoA-transferase subunit A
MSKLVSMAEAITRYVPDGASLAIGLALEALIPHAAAHEIMRQRRQGLTLIGPISDILFDQLIGAGCVEKVQAAWVGNVSEGLAHCYRRATEQGLPRPLITESHSNLSIGLALFAAGVGSPYIPTLSLLGSDLPRHNPHLRLATFDGAPVLLVPAIQPDVAIVQVQRSDEDGNAHLWGNLGVVQEAWLAARDVIVVAEEIVDRALIASDPNRVPGPFFKVRAVVHEPGGAHPAPVQGYYNRDHAFYHEYHTATRTLAGSQAWQQTWVFEVPGRAAYLEKLGQPRWQALEVREHRYAAPVDYGY